MAALKQLRALGFAVSMDAGRLIVRPGSRLTDALAAHVRARKAAILGELALEPALGGPLRFEALHPWCLGSADHGWTITGGFGGAGPFQLWRWAPDGGHRLIGVYASAEAARAEAEARARTAPGQAA